MVDSKRLEGKSNFRNKKAQECTMFVYKKQFFSKNRQKTYVQYQLVIWKLWTRQESSKKSTSSVKIKSKRLKIQEKLGYEYFHCQVSDHLEPITKSVEDTREW